METALYFIIRRLQEEFPKQVSEIYNSNQFLAEDISIKANKLFEEQIKEAYSDGYKSALNYISQGNISEFEYSKQYYNKTFKNKKR